MQDEGIIAALIGAAAGSGGLKLMSILKPPKESEVVTYYRETLRSVMEENTEQRKQIRQLLGEADHTHDRLEQLEQTAGMIERGELPPEYS